MRERACGHERVEEAGDFQELDEERSLLVIWPAELSTLTGGLAG